MELWRFINDYNNNNNNNNNNSNSEVNHTVQDSEFVRWSSTFHHVFVFTVKKRCVMFIDIVKYTL